jgi:hypothetical protein
VVRSFFENQSPSQSRVHFGDHKEGMDILQFITMPAHSKQDCLRPGSGRSVSDCSDCAGMWAESVKIFVDTDGPPEPPKPPAGAAGHPFSEEEKDFWAAKAA